MSLRMPNGFSTTSSVQDLGSGPADMPDRGGPKPNCQSTSSMVPLSRDAHPVAQFGAHPNQGTVQTNSSQVPLGQNATSPYEPISRTKPQTGGK